MSLHLSNITFTVVELVFVSAIAKFSLSNGSLLVCECDLAVSAVAGLLVLLENWSWAWIVLGEGKEEQ